MHPPLDRPHPLCQDVIENLKVCHKENRFAKFFGTCNTAKSELDKCFREEKEVARKKVCNVLLLDFCLCLIFYHFLQNLQAAIESRKMYMAKKVENKIAATAYREAT